HPRPDLAALPTSPKKGWLVRLRPSCCALSLSNMPKIDVSKVAEILKKNQLDPALLRRVIEEIKLAVQPDNAEEKLPPIKRKYVILLSDPEDRLPKHDFAGWVLQMP